MVGDFLNHSSPRTRRYFHIHRRSTSRQALFSAHAEVFPAWQSTRRVWRSLLRARGGISSCLPCDPASRSSSPRTRRYFLSCLSRLIQRMLFSAHAEVFPPLRIPRCRHVPLLRARGGISTLENSAVQARASSPRTRRYFRRLRSDKFRHLLFSAHAEVFPRPACRIFSRVPLLRARGGISIETNTVDASDISSPRTRRYFRVTESRRVSKPLFSAHAEVFRRGCRATTRRRSLLRARGGISR